MSPGSGWGGSHDNPRKDESPEEVQRKTCEELAAQSPNFKEEYDLLPPDPRYDQVRGAISAAARKARAQERQAVKPEDALAFGSEAAGLEKLNDALSPTDLKRRLDDPVVRDMLKG